MNRNWPVLHGQGGGRQWTPMLRHHGICALFLPSPHKPLLHHLPLTGSRSSKCPVWPALDPWGPLVPSQGVAPSWRPPVKVATSWGQGPLGAGRGSCEVRNLQTLRAHAIEGHEWVTSAHWGGPVPSTMTLYSPQICLLYQGQGVRITHSFLIRWEWFI